MSGLVGKKIGMTSLFDDKGKNVPCTIIEAGPCIVTQIKNNIKDILNPYFTTKKNGTGLGLSIVNKIINDHNGEINFVSISNGAKIEIIFN